MWDPNNQQPKPVLPVQGNWNIIEYLEVIQLEKRKKSIAKEKKENSNNNVLKSFNIFSLQYSTFIQDPHYSEEFLCDSLVRVNQ